MHSEESFNLTKSGLREGQKKTNYLQYSLLALILLMPGQFPILGALSLQQFLAGTKTTAKQFNILRKLKTESPIPLKHFLKMEVYIATAWFQPLQISQADFFQLPDWLERVHSVFYFVLFFLIYLSLFTLLLLYLFIHQMVCISSSELLVLYSWRES